MSISSLEFGFQLAAMLSIVWSPIWFIRWSFGWSWGRMITSFCAKVWLDIDGKHLQTYRLSSLNIFLMEQYFFKLPPWRAFDDLKLMIKTNILWKYLIDFISERSCRFSCWLHSKCSRAVVVTAMCHNDNKIRSIRKIDSSHFILTNHMAEMWYCHGCH